MQSSLHSSLLTQTNRGIRGRSRSSPSPPPLSRTNFRDTSRGKSNISTSVSRRAKQSASLPLKSTVDWSSSYHGGSSSSASAASHDESTTSCDSEDEIEDHPQQFRGRSDSQSTVRRKGSKTKRHSDERTPTRRITFTRSRSPRRRGPQQSSPRNSTFRTRPKFTVQTTVLPPSLSLDFSIPFSSLAATISIDTRKFGEYILLLTSLGYASFRLSRQISLLPVNLQPTCPGALIIPVYFLVIFTTLYLAVLHGHLHATTKNTPVDKLSGVFQQEVAPSKTKSSFLWMSVPKNYRDSIDDGVVCSMFLLPLISISLLSSALSSLVGQVPPILSGWLIEAPQYLPQSQHARQPIEALVLARYNLVELSTLCCYTLLFHICASAWFESRHSTSSEESDGERRSVPRGELRRTLYYISFTFGLTILLMVFYVASTLGNIGIWQNLNLFDLVVVSLFFQFTLYIALRLAHRGFTLGELGMVCFGATALFMEFIYFTIARIWPVTTDYIKTYRLPTPLLVYQMALITGSFLVGFLLAPFLVLSRHIASRPMRRLRDPRQNQRNKRFLALGFYVGTVLLVAGPIGLWTRWGLGKRDPWLWVIFSLVKGQRIWSRIALLAYWGLLGSISVAGWNRQLARSRKTRSRNVGEQPPTATVSAPCTPSELLMDDLPAASTLRLSLSSIPNLPTGVDVSTAANDFLDAADKHVPTLSLNARRKFFHALSVVMFIPGIALDPAFTHLAFSACFALFIFAEYVRYFAIYPFGAAVHVFMHDFLDNKDGGTAILSHFLLLSGCAGSLWLESATPIQNFTGVLVLGVGDAMASIIGKRAGKHRWSLSTFRTVEGSITFVVSVTTCAWLLKLCGLTGDFEMRQYFIIVVLSSLLEALSEQNDNLTLPLYTWSMLCFLF